MSAGLHCAARPRHARQRPGRLAAAGSLTMHTSRMVPWAALLAGSAAGIGFSLAVRLFATPGTPQAELISGVRLAFLPPVAALAFMLHDRQRQLAGALPVPPSVTTALRLALILPVMAATCSVQLWLVSRAGLPIGPVATEFAGCCLIMLAGAAAVERSRWRDLGGGAAAPAALAFIGVLAGLSRLRHSPLVLLPTAFAQLTAEQHRAWDRAWLAWAVAVAAAAIATGWFSRDPWRKMRIGRD